MHNQAVGSSSISKNQASGQKARGESRSQSHKFTKETSQTRKEGGKKSG